MIEKWHGTPGGYSNHKCRCDLCRLAWNKYCRDRKRKLREEYQFNPEDEHGTTRIYDRGCSCEACRAAHARYASQLRKGEKSKHGECMVCKDDTQVVWDHDHRTGCHRGWLCILCNQALGLFKDDVRLLETAIDYLERGK